MTRSLLIWFSVCMLALSVTATESMAAAKNGDANTRERQTYCDYKLRNCRAQVYQDCGEPEKGADASQETQDCRTSELGACESAWGKTGNCLTRIVAPGGLWEQERYDSADNVLSAPEESNATLMKSLHVEAFTSNPVAARDSKAGDRAESTVSLKANQKLLLTNGNHVERFADGSVHVIEMNGRTAQSFPGGKIVRDRTGTVSILSGAKRVEAGVFKAIESLANQRDRRKVRDHR